MFLVGQALSCKWHALAESLSRWDRGRLALRIRQVVVEEPPARPRCRPDIALRPADLGIVERTHPDHDQVWSIERLAEERRPALRTEASAHGVAAVGGADVLGERAGDGESLVPEDRVHRRVAGR